MSFEVEREKNSDDLTDYSGNCSSGNFQSGQTEQSEDQNRIQNNINDRAESLSDHVVNGLACGLQQSLKCNLHEDTDRHDTDDSHVLCTVFDDQRVAGLR